MIEYKRSLKKQNEAIIVQTPTVPRKIIEEDLANITNHIKKQVENLTQFSTSSCCAYSYYMHEDYKTTEVLVEELRRMGYSAKVSSSSGGSDYNNDGIPAVTWTSYYVSVDLTPIKVAIYG